jgi:sulfate permease, SulP family
LEGIVSTPRSEGWPTTIAAGLIIGAVETVLAVAFAAFIFGGLLSANLPDGIGLYLAAAALTVATFAWRGGRRGVVGSVQDAAAAVLAGAAAAAAAKATQIQQVATLVGLKDYEAPDVFLTVIAATLVVTVLCGVFFLLLGWRRWGNLIRFVPYPVVGGFLAGTGWLLLTGGIHVASRVQIHLNRIDDLARPYTLVRWLPALAFGVVLLLAVRIVRKPLVIPVMIGIGLAGFVLMAMANGAGLDEIREGRWLLGPFETTRLWQPWTLRAVTGADWGSVVGSWPTIATAVFVAALALLFNIGGTELLLDRDLDTNVELRDAGVLNVVSGALGGIPGYHALSLTALATRMNVDARRAGLIAAFVPLAAVVAGASVVELIPRMIVSGVLVFLGLAFIVDWIWDKRKILSRIEYLVVILILAVIIAQGYLAGIVVGLVLAALLFAFSYGRVDLVRQVSFGDTYRSNVDRPPAERAALRALRDRVLILRLSGFVFFGSTARLLERIRARVESSSPRFLVIDLRRVTGMDASAVVAFSKAMRLAGSHGSELVITGASDPVRAELERGGVTEQGGSLRFEPDLDRGLEHCEDLLLAEEVAAAGEQVARGRDGLPAGLAPYMERVVVSEGSVVLRQEEPSGDLYVLAEGRLAVETVTPEGRRVRLRILRPGVVVGELAFYTGAPRTADVVAQTPCVVLRCTREQIARIEADDPVVAIVLHRWFAETLARRLSETMHTFDSLLD